MFKKKSIIYKTYMFMLLNVNIFCRKIGGGRSGRRGGKVNYRVSYGGHSGNSEGTSLLDKIFLLARIIKNILNILCIIFIVLYSIGTISSGTKKNKKNNKKKKEIEINSTDKKLLKLDKYNKKRLNFAGIDKDTYEIMNSYILNGYETERLKVNLTTAEDIEKLGKYFDDIEMSKYTVTTEIKDEKKGKEYLKKCNQRLESYYFCIKKKDDNEPIGQINIKFYQPGELTISYWIGKKFRRNGYMSEIGLNFTEEVFFKLKNIKKLIIYLEINNKASKAYVEKLYSYLESKYSCNYNVYQDKKNGEDNSTLYYVLEKK